MLQEQIRNLPKERSQPFEKKLLAGTEILNDETITAFMDRLVQTLKKNDPVIESEPAQSLPPHFRFYRSRVPRPISFFILPPQQGFIEQKFARQLEFENELAAAVSLAWELALDTTFQENFLKQVEENDPNPKEVYQWEDADVAAAVERAVDRLYRSGYDPRGLVSMIGKIKDWNTERVIYVQEKARRTIAFYTPLMNPVVRSESFYKLRKQLEKW